jgi:hypothetical protein
VKSKNDDQQLRNFLQSPKGTLLSYNVSSLETCLRDAWRQIREFPERHDADFTVVWFITRKAGGITLSTLTDTMVLLYGIQRLDGYTVEREALDGKECFFFHESILFKYKNLDGVVLQDDQVIKLCLTPFSPRYGSFRHTRFSDLFRDQCVVVDPLEMEAANECFIADCKITKKDTQGIVRYLQGKYGLDTVTIFFPIFFTVCFRWS